MNKKPNPELIDDDNPEWSEEDFRRARPAAEVLPPELYANLLEMNRRTGVRGQQKAPTKERITIRLSRDVLERFRATGDGWQTRVDAALKEWLKSHSPV